MTISPRFTIAALCVSLTAGSLLAQSRQTRTDEYTRHDLLKPENRAALTGVLTYHVVPGRLDSKALWERVAAVGGMAELKTVGGETLTIKANGPSNLVVEDERGGTATISTYDVYQSNGVIHVIDEVLLPS